MLFQLSPTISSGLSTAFNDEALPVPRIYSIVLLVVPAPGTRERMFLALSDAWRSLKRQLCEKIGQIKKCLSLFFFFLPLHFQLVF